MRRAAVIAAASSMVVALAAPAAHAGAVNLRFRADAGPGTTVRTATLACDGEGPRATGYLRSRNATKLCARAYALEAFLAKGPPTGRACTDIYGGPDRARVRGNVRGSSIDRRFSRVDGCEIADWDRAQRLLTRPVDAAR